MIKKNKVRKHRVMYALSNDQNQNAINSALSSLMMINKQIDVRCSRGEDVPDTDPQIIKVRKLRQMLAALGEF